MNDQAQPNQKPAEPRVPRIFLTVEIRGGDPATAKVYRETIESEVQTAVLWLQAWGAFDRRKKSPQVILHPVSVEA